MLSSRLLALVLEATGKPLEFFSVALVVHVMCVNHTCTAVHSCCFKLRIEAVLEFGIDTCDGVLVSSCSHLRAVGRLF